MADLRRRSRSEWRTYAVDWSRAAPAAQGRRVAWVIRTTGTGVGALPDFMCHRQQSRPTAQPPPASLVPPPPSPVPMWIRLGAPGPSGVASHSSESSPRAAAPLLRIKSSSAFCCPRLACRRFLGQVSWHEVSADLAKASTSFGLLQLKCRPSLLRPRRRDPHRHVVPSEMTRMFAMLPSVGLGQPCRTLGDPPFPLPLFPFPSHPPPTPLPAPGLLSHRRPALALLGHSRQLRVP